MIRKVDKSNTYSNISVFIQGRTSSVYFSNYFYHNTPNLYIYIYIYIYIYKINLNRESEFSYKSFTLTAHQGVLRLPDEPLR